MPFDFADLNHWRIPAELERILLRSPALADAYLVGGCVRDALLGLPGKDFDVEVYGVDPPTLVAALAQWGRVDTVGQSFGVIKLTTPDGETHDFSLPRRDSKVGSGHRGFEIRCDPSLRPEEAAARRDYTINALMFDYRRKRLLDFTGGLDDLRSGTLRHVGPAFSEDPLRVLRGMQFAARFRLVPAPQTIEVARSIRDSFPELAVERVREEWFKWAARGRSPSAGLRFLAETGWLGHFPELEAMRGVPQDPEWHPEGDVFVHTGHVCDALAQQAEWQAADEETRIVLMLAALLHDVAKPSTTETVEREGRARVVSPGHDNAARPLVESFLARLGCPHAIAKRVPPLVANHMAHLQPLSDRSIRRLAKRLEPETIEHLFRLIAADYSGRPPRPATVSPSAIALREKASELSLAESPPQPILLGRHLLAHGVSPGKAMGEILDAAFEAQLDGEFQDLAGAEAWFQSRAGSASPENPPPFLSGGALDRVPRSGRSGKRGGERPPRQPACWFR